MVEQILFSLKNFLPETVLVITLCAAIIFDLFLREKSHLTSIIVLIGLVVCAHFLLEQTNIKSMTIFSQMYTLDPFSVYFKWIILLAGFFIVIFSLQSDEIRLGSVRLGEYYSLLVAMILGMFLMTGASNILMMYLSIELTGISSYILAGYTKHAKDSSEASLKYVIYGALASGLMLYGFSILYGLTGAVDIYSINNALSAGDVNTITLVIANILILAGFGYKISAVPFHFWTPDVYEGAPTTITAFLSVASKAAGFAIMIRYFKVSFIDIYISGFSVGTWTLLKGFDWNYIIAVLSVLTMTIGNLIAIWQNNLKRLLAYSSIAHAGYMLMGIVVLNDLGITAILIYFFVYLFMNLGAFYLVIITANYIKSENIEDYRGLGYQIPLVGVAMTIFLLSLTGIPPTAGFIGKFYLFSALMNAKWFWLAIIGVLNTVVSLYYYFRILRNMYLREVEVTTRPIMLKAGENVMIMVLIIPTLLFGVYFSPLVELAQASVSIFLK